MIRALSAALISVAFAVPAFAGDDVHYAKTNLHINRNVVSVINYTEGKLLKIGTKVRIEKKGKKFWDLQAIKGPRFRFYTHRSTRMSLDEAFKFHFGKSDPRDKVAALKKKDQAFVKKGKVRVGMHKDAVLLSWGRPPPHKTPSLDSSEFLYWKSKMSKVTIVFDDNDICIDDGSPKPEVVKEPDDNADIRYASSNVYTDKGEEISWVNYLKGPIIPIGTKVEVTDIDDDEVEFKVVKSGKEYSFTNEEKKSGYHARDLFERMFSKSSPKAKLNKLPKKQRRRVKGAKVKVGMSKEAVIMAIGPPPPHETPSLDSEEWIYWKGRFNKIKVVFDDDDVVMEIGK